MDWIEIKEAVLLAEELGFEGFFASDHLMGVAGFSEELGLLDAVSLLLALASVTTTVRLGAMVSPITIRHPVVLARAIQTLDIVSSGRADLGVGAGWSAEEHAAFGIPFPPAPLRLELFEDACRTLVSLWEGKGPVTVDGAYPLNNAMLRPVPIQPRAPLMVAGASDRAVKIAARWGRAWNATGSPQFLRERVVLLREEEVRVGRPGAVETSATVRLQLCETEHEAEQRIEAMRSTPRERRAQRNAVLPGEDPALAAYIGPVEGVGLYAESLAEVGIERAVLPLPRPWDPAQLRRMAAAVFH